MPKPPPKGPLEPLKNDSPPAPKSVRGKPVLDGRPAWAGPYAASLPPAVRADPPASLQPSPPIPEEPPMTIKPPEPPSPASPVAPAVGLASASASDIPANLLGRFGGPRGPEYRVFPVTKDGRGTKLFTFPPEAYADTDALRAKIARDHGPGEYDVILYNEKGQPVTGGTSRVYVDEGPRAASPGLGAPVLPAPVVVHAPAPQSTMHPDMLELVKIMAGRPVNSPKPVDWAGLVTAIGTGVVGIGGLVVPIIVKTLDLKAGPRDPLEGIEKAVTMADRMRKLLGEGGGLERKGKFDAISDAIAGGVEMMKELHGMVKAENAKPAPRALPRPPPPAAPAVGTQQPPQPAPTPPQTAAEPSPTLQYAADNGGLLAFVNDNMADLCEMADAGKRPAVVAGYLHALLDDHAHLVPIVADLLAAPEGLAKLAAFNSELKARLPWFEQVRARLIAAICDDEASEAPHATDPIPA